MRGLRSTLFALVAAALVATASTSAAADPRGVFVVHCGYSHSLRDDPIVHRGLPGASHMHDFFGSTTTNAMSTVRRMRRSSTTCRLASDTSGYWFPAAYLGDLPLQSTFAKVYYFGVPRIPVELVPRGVKIMAGEPAAGSASENPRVTWSCGAKGNKRTPIVDHPYDCTPFARRWHFVDSVVARVDLPSCWDGEGLKPSDVSYLEDDGCPDGFAHRLPRIRMQVHIGTLDPCQTGLRCSADGSDENVTLRLSSGPYFTFHADFWNTWHQRALERLTDRCLVRHRPCGVVSDL